jgi:phosphopantetheinyl transferase
MLLQLNNLTLQIANVEALYRDDFQSFFPQALNERIGERNNEESKKQSVAAYILLEKMLIEHYGLTLKDLKFTENGKPYLKDGPFVSVSHTEGFVCAAVSDLAIGVDIEQLREFDFKIADRFFSSREKSYILKKDSIKRFFTLWTLKEAIIKLEGRSLGNIGGINLNMMFGRFFYKNYRLITKIHENCVISVCFSEKTGK